VTEWSAARAQFSAYRSSWPGRPWRLRMRGIRLWRYLIVGNRVIVFFPMRGISPSVALCPVRAFDGFCRVAAKIFLTRRHVPVAVTRTKGGNDDQANGKRRAPGGGQNVNVGAAFGWATEHCPPAMGTPPGVLGEDVRPSREWIPRALVSGSSGLRRRQHRARTPPQTNGPCTCGGYGLRIWRARTYGSL